MTLEGLDDGAPIREARQAQKAAAQRRLSAAAARAERGQIQLTQLDYLGAAEHFRAASNLVPAEAHDQRGQYLGRYARALTTYGDEKGDNAALLQAIAIRRRALVELPRERVPLQWATTQTNLGTVLQTLGERERGTVRLEEAVQAFRAALNILDAAHAEYYRAIAQRNLDEVSSILEARNSGK